MTTQEALSKFPINLSVCLEVSEWRYAACAQSEKAKFKVSILPGPSGGKCDQFLGTTLDEAVNSALAAVSRETSASIKTMDDFVAAAEAA